MGTADFGLRTLGSILRDRERIKNYNLRMVSDMTKGSFLKRTYKKYRVNSFLHREIPYERAGTSVCPSCYR